MTHQHRRTVGRGYFDAASSFVCWGCHYVARAGFGERRHRRCPTCRGVLQDVGKNFKVPSKTDTRGWRSAESKFGPHTLPPRPISVT